MKIKVYSILIILLFIVFCSCDIVKTPNNIDSNSNDTGIHDNESTPPAFDKYINYPDDVEINLDPWWHWEISPTYIDFEAYDDLYKFTSCVYYNKSTEKYLDSGFYDVFEEEEYKVFTSNLLIPLQSNGNYTIRRISYQDKGAFRVLYVSFDALSENESIAFFVYEKNEKSLADRSESIGKYSENRQEKITVGDYEIPMYFGVYDTSSQTNMWYGYCVTSDFIIQVSIGSDGAKDVAAGLEMAKDFEFVPLTEYPNLEK